MAFWGEDKWIVAHSARPIIEEFDLSLLQEGNYRLRLGDEAIVSSSNKDKESAHRRLNRNTVLSLEPGHFAYLITREVVHIPANAIGLINVSTSEKFNGLINISGFHADPLYSGKLVFTVFNAGPLIISLSPDEELFRLWLSDFSPAATQPPKASYQSLNKKWASRLQGIYPSSFALATTVHRLEKDVERLGQQRIYNAFIIGIITLLLAPFAAAMWVELFKHWFK